MKKLLPLILFAALLFTLFALSTSAADYYVYDATDILGKISAKVLSVSNEYTMTDDSLYVRVNTLANGTGSDSTEIQINVSNIANDFYIKDYPVMKMGYRSNIADTSARLDINIGLDYNGTATRVWGITTNYDRTGADSAYIIDISAKANGGEGITGYNWNNVDADSYVNYVRFKPYYNQKVMKAGEYFDVEYVAFFKNVADAEAFNFNYDFENTEYSDMYLAEQVRRGVVGDTIKLNIAYAPSFLSAPAVTFKSNDTSIATVDGNGIVTLKKAGNTTVTATYGNFSSTCKIISLAEEIAPVDFVLREGNTGVTPVKTSHLGDSITTYAPSPNGGNNYHDWWAKWFYIDNEDKGISGASLTANGQNPFVYRFDQMRADAELITVKGGTNDVGMTALGSMYDRSLTTYRGSLRYLMEGLIERYPDKKIVFFTVIKRVGWSETERKNGFGNTLSDYADAVMELAEIYGIDAIDIYNPEELNFVSAVISPSGFDENGKWFDAVCEDDRMPDGLHPSGKGHKIIANYMISEMIRLNIINAPNPGDVNDDGKVDLIDLIVLSRNLAGWNGYGDSMINKTNANVNADSEVNLLDVVILARHLAKWNGYDRLPKSN